MASVEEEPEIKQPDDKKNKFLLLMIVKKMEFLEEFHIF